VLQLIKTHPGGKAAAAAAGGGDAAAAGGGGGKRSSSNSNSNSSSSSSSRDGGGSGSARAPAGGAAHKEWGEFLHAPGKVFYDFERIRAEVASETERVSGGSKNISDKPIRLKIYSPNVL
jgi:hypothetical protein